ncbi:MAG: hypothetical protein ACD_37C00136G0005 [uncultured bacterium]|nr:MAG: hypothetical protein ACD_37C00136G0005 [uncultured bacterium]KKR15441.1 MAG: hypothetical protein UT44_C0034G0011 [Candidatus Levybacteria bacterium GW2011_GWA1_39_32]KKR50797.1 MAG: hypothetical protein UT87_C0012G0042 [Candidatus Levybacteria bacterium GW2011_GWC1_40_19]KKR93199.1 MAG: hypothetical protein UU45_C0025G0003 [Candidatus Levybacteria bacterium GW2011_GWA2_41_15]KKS00453.1 MAG: hypothetical protein UU52_C0033G0015 [Candidatus Levybacteria bacterium GW2011_GWB1_41_21]OGH20
MPETIKVAVLLEHHEGDEKWTAHVPTLESQPDSTFIPLAEGATPEEAAQALVPEIQTGTGMHPDILPHLKRAPQFALTEIAVEIPDQNA